jgi:diguanylate cyclase (GGDEF)-like protein/PAS domain S-box-containing protein
VHLVVSLTLHDIGRPVGNTLAHLMSGCDDLIRAVQSVLDTRAPEDVQVQSAAGQWFEARYQALVDWSPEAINILRHGVFIYVNPVSVKAYGATSPQDLLGTPSRDRVHPGDLPAALERLAHVTRHRVDAPRVEMRFLRLDGLVMNVEAQATSIDYEGEPAIQVAWRDITRQKSVEAQQLHNHERIQRADEVLYLAFHDELTQLSNRRVLNDRMRQAMLSSKRSACYGALMFLDLDGFKYLNDTYGHAAGDVLLIEVARRLKHCVRETDTVGRFGGDEFVVMLSQLSTDRVASIQQATGLAEKIRLALAQPHQLSVPDDGVPTASIAHVCTSSIGLALFINDDTRHDDVLKWADTAMYHAKKAGRNRVHLHEPVVDASRSAHHRQALHHRAQQARPECAKVAG